MHMNQLLSRLILISLILIRHIHLIPSLFCWIFVSKISMQNERFLPLVSFSIIYLIPFFPNHFHLHLLVICFLKNKHIHHQRFNMPHWCCLSKIRTCTAKSLPSGNGDWNFPRKDLKFLYRNILEAWKKLEKQKSILHCKNMKASVS